MKLSTAKRYVRGYKESCIKRTGKPPEHDTLLRALTAFARHLKMLKIDL